MVLAALVLLGKVTLVVMVLKLVQLAVVVVKTVLEFLQVTTLVVTVVLD
jgi:hypothetical protein